MKVLQELLEEDELSRFLAENFSKFPYSRPNAAARFKHLIGWKEVAAIQAQGQSIFRIVKNNQMLIDKAQLNAKQLKAHFQMGHSLVIRHAEKSNAELALLAQDFEQAFDGEVDIQLFMTPAKERAFGWHYDAEDVFIIQVSGCKQFTLRQNTINPRPTLENMPLDLQYEKEKSPFVVKCRLEAGDWLYIPTGWWHATETLADSTHISLGVFPGKC